MAMFENGNWGYVIIFEMTVKTYLTKQTLD